MSEEKRDFSKYDKMSTEELKEALRHCVTQSDGDADAELYIAGLVAEREKREHPERYPDVGDEWERFKTLYIPLADETDGERETPEVSAKPRKYRRRMSIGRRIAVSLAAALLLCAALVGTALAVNEDLRIAVYRSLGKHAWFESARADMLERARINEFPNKVALWLYDELEREGLYGRDSETGEQSVLSVYPLEWSDTEGVYAGLVSVIGLSDDPEAGGVTEEVYIVKHTWTGYKITGRFGFEPPEEGENITLGRIDDTDYTLIYGCFGGDERLYRTLEDGTKSSTPVFNAIQFSDGSLVEMRTFGKDVVRDCGVTFVAIAWGDHRDADVTDLVEADNWISGIDGHAPTEDELQMPEFRPTIVRTYTETFGEALPEPTVP